MATVYHVKTTGNDSTGDGSDGSPWLTIAKGLATMAAGDTLEIHTGTYVEHMQDRIKAGISAGSPTVVKAHGSSGAYDTVTVRPPNGVTAGLTRCVNITSRKFITIKGIIFDGVNGTTSSDDCVKLNGACDNFIIEDCELKNAEGIGLNVQPLASIGTDNGRCSRCHIHDQISSLHRPHGVYLQTGGNWLFEYNDIHDNSGYGFHIYPNSNGSTFRYNRVHHNGRNLGAGMDEVILTGDNHLFERNWVYNPTETVNMGVRLQYSTPANTIVRHNTIVDCGSSNATSNGFGIYIASDSTGVKITNNLVIGSSTPIQNTAGSGATVSGNVTTGTPTSLWTDYAGFDFTLKAGSAAIDSGSTVVIPGVNYNGTSPDAGASETFKFTSASIENSATSSIAIQFQININSPLLPATDITGFTAKKNGANNPVTAAIVSGVNTVVLTVQNAYANGDTASISYSGGNLTNSAKFGDYLALNGTNQPYVEILTNQVVTNNVTGADAAPAVPTGLTVVRL